MVLSLLDLFISKVEECSRRCWNIARLCKRKICYKMFNFKAELQANGFIHIWNTCLTSQKLCGPVYSILRFMHHHHSLVTWLFSATVKQHLLPGCDRTVKEQQTDKVISLYSPPVCKFSVCTRTLQNTLSAFPPSASLSATVQGLTGGWNHVTLWYSY